MTDEEILQQQTQEAPPPPPQKPKTKCRFIPELECHFKNREIPSVKIDFDKKGRPQVKFCTVICLKTIPIYQMTNLDQKVDAIGTILGQMSKMMALYIRQNLPEPPKPTIPDDENEPDKTTENTEKTQVKPND